MTNVELTRRRILGGLVTIGAGSAAAGAGTFALFSDSETDSASFSAGTLDLATGSTSDLTFSSTNIAPTQTGSGTIDLTQSSSGSFTAALNVGVGDVASDATPGSGNDDGNLDEQLGLKISIDEGQTGTYDDYLNLDGSNNAVVESSPSGYFKASNLENKTWGDVTLDSEFPVTARVEWKFLDDSNANVGNNNDAQGHDITVNFDFTLEQQSN